MSNGANYKRGKLHHSPWHSDIRTSNQLNTQYTKSDRRAFNRIQDLQLLMFVDWFERWTAGQLSIRWCTCRSTCLCTLTILSWMASFQASSTIEYLTLDNHSQRLIVDTIASMNHFATSNVAFWCWGTFWSALALGCGPFWSPLGLGCGTIWADGTRSDLVDFLRRAVCCLLSSGGAIDPGGCRECGSWGHPITVSALLHFFGKGAHVGCNDLSRPAWP